MWPERPASPRVFFKLRLKAVARSRLIRILLVASNFSWAALADVLLKRAARHLGRSILTPYHDDLAASRPIC